MHFFLVRRLEAHDLPIHFSLVLLVTNELDVKHLTCLVDIRMLSLVYAKAGTDQGIFSRSSSFLACDLFDALYALQG